MGQVINGILAPKSVTAADLADAANLVRTQMAPVTLDIFPIDLLSLREWDALAVTLPATPTSTYLGVTTGATYGTNPPSLQTGDLKATTTTRRGRCIIQLPNYYVAAAQVSIYAIAKMLTTVADTSSLLTVEAYQLNDDASLSGQLVTGGAQSINSLSLGTKNFPLTTTTLVPGSRLDCRFSITVTDAATVTAVIGYIHALYLKCNVQP